jgi:hypothetical protein
MTERAWPIIIGIQCWTNPNEDKKSQLCGSHMSEESPMLRLARAVEELLLPGRLAFTESGSRAMRRMRQFTPPCANAVLPAVPRAAVARARDAGRHFCRRAGA